MKKNIFALLSFILYIPYIHALGILTNNGNIPISVIMYDNTYTAPTETISAKGRLNKQGIIIQPGQNVNFLTNTTSIDVFYGNIKGLHKNIDNNQSYTVSPRTINLDRPINVTSTSSVESHSNPTQKETHSSSEKSPENSASTTNANFTNNLSTNFLEKINALEWNITQDI